MYMKTRMKKSKKEREIDLEWLIITSEESVIEIALLLWIES